MIFREESRQDTRIIAWNLRGFGRILRRKIYKKQKKRRCSSLKNFQRRTTAFYRFPAMFYPASTILVLSLYIKAEHYNSKIHLVS